MALLLASCVHFGSSVPADVESTGCAAQQSELSLLQYGIHRVAQDAEAAPNGPFLKSDLPYDDHNDLEAFSYARKKAAAAASGAAGDSSAAAPAAEAESAPKEAAKEAAKEEAPKEAAKEAGKEAGKEAAKSLLQLEESIMLGTDAAPAKEPAPKRQGDGFLEDDLPFDDHNALEKASYALKTPAAKPAATGGADSTATESPPEADSKADSKPADADAKAAAPDETKEAPKEDAKAAGLMSLFQFNPSDTFDASRALDSFYYTLR